MTVFLYLALAVLDMEMAAITATTHTLTATPMADRALFQRHRARPPFAIERLHRHGPDHLLATVLNSSQEAPHCCFARTVDLIYTIAASVPAQLARWYRLLHCRGARL